MTLLAASPVRAHEVGLSRGDFSADGAAVRAEVAFARKELASLVAGLDANHDGAFTVEELDAGRDAIQGAVVGRITITGDGAPCAGKLERVDLSEQDGVAVRALYRCPRRPREASVTLTFIQDLPFGHRHLARAFTAVGPLDLVLSQRSPTFSFALPPDARAGRPTSDRSPGALGRAVAASGWPVPVFLVGLLARSPNRRAAFLTALAFAVALLGGLLGSRLGLFTPSPRAVAAAVALSLAYVGVDNLAGGEPRPWIAMPFGVVHGLAAAALLRALEAPPLPFALGTLAALAVLVPAIVPAVRWLGARARGVTMVSAAVALAGLAGLGALYLMPG